MGMSTKDERLAMSHPESFIAPDISDNGLLRAATRDATVWLYARIPWSTALLDGANDQKRTEVASSMLQFFNGLANMVPQSAIQYRTLLKDEYREFHILTGSMVENYHPPLTDGRNGRYAELARYQTYYYRQWKARRQFAVIGVPLKIIPEHSAKRKKPLLDRFFTGLDRAAYNLATGHATFDEYMPDAHRVENIMRNAGFQPFTCMDANERERLIAQMETWWVSRANASALPIIAENDHVHFFPDGALCQEAKRLYDEGKECEEWGIDNEYPACMCFARTSNFEESLISDPMNLWIAQLMEASTAGGANAVGVSIRGKVEPAKVTQDTLRRNQHAIDDSIRERQTKGREATMGMEELQQRLAYKRSVYSVPDAPPSIIDLSIAACVAGNARIAVDALSHVPRLEFVNLTTANEQLLAFKSMQACSPIRMTPYEMHWTATTVAGGGVSSFATAGDKNGALLGLTEANRQPVYIGTTTVQDEDRLPFMAVIANSGAGKALHIFSTIPVPPQPRFPQGGTPQVIDLKEGDLVYGRDGKPYPILQLHPIHTEDLYEVTLSDGQKIKASGDHQWVVSDFKDRNAERFPAHRKSIQRRDRLRDAQRRLHDIALSRPEDERLTVKEIADITEPVFREWADGMKPERYVSDVMRFMEVPAIKETRTIKLRNDTDTFTTLQNCRRWEPREALDTLIGKYEYIAEHGKRWQEESRIRADILRSHLNDKFEQGLSVSDLRRIMGDNAPRAASISSALAEITPVSEWDETQRTRSHGSLTKPVNTYNARQAIDAIGMRNLLRYENMEETTEGYTEQVVTTREMLDTGLKSPNAGKMWAIHASKPVEGVEQELPLDPWVFGAWLSDGTRRGGLFSSDGRNGDLQYLSERLEKQGFKVKRVCNSDGEISTTGLTPILRTMGVLENKHIPEQYFNASIQQRLALVQGMLDQDGTISDGGRIEFTQSADHEDIVRGMVRLLRSLGIIVCEPRFGASGYTAKDGKRHETQGRWRINFTTSLPVFTLPRKKAKITKEMRATQQWLYVADIRKVEDAPHRCLTVDSPDHTFLVGDYVPTHNTMALFSLCLQWSKIQGRDGRGYTPCVYINPKEGDDLVDATESQGGRVVRLDSDVANGTFDPLNVLENEEEAKETAAIMLSDILHPNGADPEDELALTAMLDYGIKHGAKCCGIALHTAAQAYVSEQKAGRDPSGIDLPPSTLSVYRQVSSAIKHNQNIRLIFGTRNDTPPLKLSQGLTLISAGSRSLVPTPGSEANMTGRIQQWVLRMVVLGAGAAVRGRDGMVCLDEAWVAMGKGSGTSKTLQQWGRMARSQRFTPVLASQKVQEFIDAGLTGAISRAILMSLDNPVEDNGTVSPAKSALRLLQIEDPSGRMLYRMGLGDTKDNKEPNWQSLRRLVNPNTGETIRGAVCYFKDGSNQPIPVEIIIPPDLLKEISTTATAKIERQQRKKAQEQS